MRLSKVKINEDIIKRKDWNKIRNAITDWVKETISNPEDYFEIAIRPDSLYIGFYGEIKTGHEYIPNVSIVMLIDLFNKLRPIWIADTTIGNERKFIASGWVSIPREELNKFIDSSKLVFRKAVNEILTGNKV